MMLTPKADEHQREEKKEEKDNQQVADSDLPLSPSVLGWMGTLGRALVLARPQPQLSSQGWEDHDVHEEGADDVDDGDGGGSDGDDRRNSGCGLFVDSLLQLGTHATDGTTVIECARTMAALLRHAQVRRQRNKILNERKGSLMGVYNPWRPCSFR
jgi:hypothetical protein